MKKLAIITTHPIQYQIPLFKKLKKSKIKAHVFFASRHGLSSNEIDHEFKVKVNWKINQNLTSKYKNFFSPNQKFSINDFRLSFSGLEKHFIKNKYDAVLLCGWNKLIYLKAFFLAKKLKIKTILRVETNLNLQISPIKKNIKYFILKYLFKYIDYFLYIGILNKFFFLKHGVPSKKLFSSPYCVDNEYFKKKKIKKTKLKKKLNLNYKIIILYVGKFIERKKPLDYLELTKKFIHNKQVHFVMIGNGDLMHDCKKFIKNNFLNNVSIIGFKNQNELKNYYHISDLLVITSKYETWGLVINEAMASGLPVIATKQCGATEDLIKNAKTGYLYNHYELNKLFSNFNKFLNKIDLKKKIKKNIQIKIKNYNYEQTISSLKKILNDK